MTLRLPRLLAALAVVLVVAGAGALRADAQTDSRCFDQTGQCIAGAIRQYWERNGGLEVFGYPTTPLRSERVEGWTGPVQWFERDRLEDHSAEGQGVLAGRLGVERLAQQGRPWQQRPARPAAAGCVAFSETGYAMCGAFRTYWERNGGLSRFGYPVTDEFEEVLEGRPYRVQYFERRRMEYHPEFGPNTVLLGLLGNEVRGQRPPPQAATATSGPARPTATPSPTRTPGALDEGVAGAIGGFENGGIVCREVSGAIFSPDGGPDVGSLGTLEAPCVFDLSFQGYAPGQRLEVVIRGPDGGGFAERELAVDESGAALWRAEFLLGVPLGAYTVDLFLADGAQQRGSIDVGLPAAPRALVLPTAADSRDTLRLFASGLPAGGSYRVYLYRWPDRNASTANFVRRLGELRVDGRGEGALPFAMQPGDPSAIYQAGYFVPASLVQNFNNCTNDPLDSQRSFCFETFEYNP